MVHTFRGSKINPMHGLSQPPLETSNQFLGYSFRDLNEQVEANREVYSFSGSSLQWQPALYFCKQLY